MPALGNLENPLTLAEVNTDLRIKAGDEIVMRGMPTSGDYTMSRSGASGKLLSFRNYQDEQPQLDGSITINGGYVEYRNLEIFYSGWLSRESAEEGSSPSDIPLKLFHVNAPNSRFINCIIHDLREVGFWSGANDSEFYGCLMFNIGWTAPDRGHGHGIYTQNIAGSKRIEDCIIFNNFGWGIHAYSSNAINLFGMQFIGNTCFNAGKLNGSNYIDILIGSGTGMAQAPIIRENMSYGTSTGLQFYSNGAEDVTLEDNYCPNGKTGMYTALSESGNYWGSAIGNQTFLRPNRYQSGRANLTIYNQAQADSVQVDVSSVLSAGRAYKLRNVQDYFVDIQTGTVAQDGTITVNMPAINRSVQAPIAWNAPATTFPDFGCFVLEAV